MRLKSIFKRYNGFVSVYKTDSRKLTSETKVEKVWDGYINCFVNNEKEYRFTNIPKKYWNKQVLYFEIEHFPEKSHFEILIRG